ncbi:hypothetical protein K435DRAFT_799278 [Dendrothele bispora CBS 962.96]|uniref:Uncharacterized protein n=1 Tax=Dendrothele bispora (strain CBS 962.96) TaxID=1314807 RepID=A0A4S8LWS8_DENBC|nr:hypothetical protein K435DRAFT_799278 [Dendrothele bispora CBS 962.96]
MHYDWQDANFSTPNPVFYVSVTIATARTRHATSDSSTKLSPTAKSFLVAYTSLAWTASDHGKGKSKGKGENYEERHKAEFKHVPSVSDSDEVDQIHESIFKVYTKSMESAKKGNMKGVYVSLSYICSNHLKGNHCKHILQSLPSFHQNWPSIFSPTSRNVHLLDFVHNHEALVLMKESLEIKRKTGEGSVQAITGDPLLLSLYEKFLEVFIPSRSSDEKKAR